MTNNHNAKSYGSVQYWDERYAKQPDITFDWVDQYPEIRPILNEKCVRVLYEQKCSAEDKIRLEREKDEELKRWTEKYGAKENENGEEGEEHKATAGVEAQVAADV